MVMVVLWYNAIDTVHDCKNDYNNGDNNDIMIILIINGTDDDNANYNDSKKRC